MDVNFSYIEGIKVLKLLSTTSNPLVHFRIGKYEFKINFVHSCTISNKIFLDFKKTNQINKNYEFKCAIYDDRTHEILQKYIAGIDKVSNVSESVLRDLYNIGCAIDNKEFKMQYIQKCFPQEITFDNVEEFSDRAVFLESEDPSFCHFVDFVASHLSEINLDVLCRIASSHGYDFFENIITKSSSNEKKNNFIMTMIETDIKYSRFVGNIETSDEISDYIQRISSIVQNNNENDHDIKFLNSFLTTNYIDSSTNKLSEMQNQIDSLSKKLSEQQNQIELSIKKLSEQQNHIESLNKTNSEQQNHVESLIKINSKQQNQINLLIKTNAEQQNQIDSLIKTNSEQQKQIDSIDKLSSHFQNQIDSIGKMIITLIKHTNTVFDILEDACSSKNKYIFLFAKENNLLNIKNNYGDAPIHFATSKNNPDLVKVLYDFGADISLKDNYGNAPIHIAARNKNPDLVKVLYDFGADTSLKNNYGDAPIHIAARNKNPDVIKVLCNFGADISLKDNYGDAPIHIAARNKNPDVIKVLCDRGADINAVDTNNKTALQNASKYYKTQIVDYLLQQKGIKVDKSNLRSYSDDILDIYRKYGY